VLGENYRQLARQATERLEMFADPDGRRRWQGKEFADQFARIDRLDQRRRDLASSAPKGPEIRAVWQQIKSLQVDILDATVRRISWDHQISRIDYWDSRGALWPWCVGMGGEAFYREVVERAQVYEEPAEARRPRAARMEIREHYEPHLITRRENYQIVDWGSAESQQARFEVLAANVDLAGKRLLDIGCGLGDLWEFLKRRCITTHYTGVDLLESMARAAGRSHPEVRFVCADVFSEEAFRPGEFEVVFCSGALNLNLGNNDAFVPLAAARMLKLSCDCAVFNLLHKRTTDRDRRYFYYDPEDVARSLAPLDCRIDIFDDYLPNDFTVICSKVV
jgi:SAM-dependent methyltransferase